MRPVENQEIRNPCGKERAVSSGFLDCGGWIRRNRVRTVHGRVEQGSNHHYERRDDRKRLDADTGNHLLLDAEAQAGYTGVRKKGTLEAPSGLEPEPQV